MHRRVPVTATNRPMSGGNQAVHEKRDLAAAARFASLHAVTSRMGADGMTRIILTAAALAMAASGASACEFMRSASTKVDNMTVASTATSQSVATELAIPTDRRVKDDMVGQEG